MLNLTNLRKSVSHKEAPTNKAREALELIWLRLIRTENVGPVTFYKLLNQYGSALKAIEALPALAKSGGRKKPLIAPDEATIKNELKALKKLGGQLLLATDEAYPPLLAEINDPPPVLAVLGNIEALSKPSVAIIGARNGSTHGRTLAHTLAKDLGAQGYNITSGLARGIDTAAHQGALETGTVAVLAGGIDVIYPPENDKLYKDIVASGGAIISEAPFGTQPINRHFPRRNRIVSGLSKGVVVVEATLKSGSLITAKMAGDQGRDVFAVPGAPADPRSSGPNALIKDGAILTQNAQDVLEHLNSYLSASHQHTLFDSANDDSASFQAPKDLTKPIEITDNMRKTVTEILSIHATDIDEIIRTCQLSNAAVQTILLELELAGRLEYTQGNKVALIQALESHNEFE